MRQPIKSERFLMTLHPAVKLLLRQVANATGHSLSRTMSDALTAYARRPEIRAALAKAEEGE